MRIAWLLACVLAAGVGGGEAWADPPAGGTSADPTGAMNAEVVRLLDAGRYQDALPIAQRVLEMRERAYGPADVRVAVALNNLADAYRETGQCDRALPLHQRALRIWENALGQSHPAVATGLNNLAATYDVLGQYDRALPLHERALRIRENALGQNHLDVANSLNNLGEVYYAMGQYDRAQSLHERALRIRETSLGQNHPDVAQSLNHLAASLGATGQHNLALPYLEQALRILEFTLGQNHPRVAYILNNLAVTYRALGESSRALPLGERALVIWENVLGRNHPNVAASLNNLAATFASLGQHDRAVPLLERALDITENALGQHHTYVAFCLNNLADTFVSLSRYDRALPLRERALGILARGIEQLASHQREDGIRQFLRNHRGDLYVLTTYAMGSDRDPCWRSLALTATLLMKARGEEETTATLAAIRRDHSPEARELLDRWIGLRRRVSILDERAPRAERDRIAEELRVTEEQLARFSAAMRERRQITDTAGLVSHVAEHLAPGTALVEIASFRPFNPRHRTENERWGSPHYAAFVLHADGTHGVVDLGESAPIDALARALLPAPHGPRRSPEDVARAGRALYARLFAPVRSLLRSDTRRLILAPDGPLHFAPLHLMHDGGAWLMDRYTVSYVTTGRDLLRERSAEDLPSAPVAILATHYSTPAWEIHGLASQRFAIPHLLPGVRVFDDAAATERSLLDVSAPQILHVGAHGYFATRGPQTYAVMQRGRLLLGDAVADPATLSLPAPVPVVRDDGHDGVVTASELLPVNLRGTRLVVLSACDTAVGEASVGDGVLGLRRAFLLAGAEALVTTQWAVEERPGNVFTVALYEGLRAGLRYADAVTRAMRVVRARHPDPFAWAPFILVGRDEAIDWNTPFRAPTVAAAPTPAP